MIKSKREVVYEKIFLAQRGDESAKEELLSSNMKLVYKIVSHYKNSKIEYEDLVQSASIGLLNAILRFDPSYDVAFSTYAFPMILGEIRKLFRENNMIKKSRLQNETLKKIKNAKQDFIFENSREPTINEISEVLNIDREKIVFALSSALPIQSLEANMYDSDEILKDKISSETDTQQTAINNILIEKATKGLDKRSKKIIYMRYYQGKTQSDIAKEIGVSQVQISRIEKKVLLDMRKKVSENC